MRITRRTATGYVTDETKPVVVDCLGQYEDMAEALPLLDRLPPLDIGQAVYWVQDGRIVEDEIMALKIEELAVSMELQSGRIVNAMAIGETLFLHSPAVK